MTCGTVQTLIEVIIIPQLSGILGAELVRTLIMQRITRLTTSR